MTDQMVRIEDLAEQWGYIEVVYRPDYAGDMAKWRWTVRNHTGEGLGTKRAHRSGKGPTLEKALENVEDVQ